MVATEKQVKAAIKEGGKKGQDLQGMNAMGGVKFFGVVVETALGERELLMKVLEGMNKVVDDSADERKGGAGEIGKTLLYADNDVLLMLSHVPECLEGDISQKEWFGAICEAVKATPEDTDQKGVMFASVKADADNEIFPLKLREAASNKSYEFLVGKGLVRPESDDDDENYAENAGIEW